MRIFKLLTIIIIFFGCSFKDNSSSIDNIKHEAYNPEITITTETRYAFLKGITSSGGENCQVYYITVDYVDYFEGEEAQKAEWKDKAYMIIDGDTMTGITDGYYISNINDKLRTFKITPSTTIGYVLDDDGAHKLENKTPNCEQLRAYQENKTLLILHVKEGLVESIDERFLP